MLKMVPTVSLSNRKISGMPWPETGATHYHTQLRLSDIGRAIKESGCMLDVSQPNTQGV